MHKVFWSENLKGRGHLKTYIQMREQQKQGDNCGLDEAGSEQGPVADPCEHGNEPSGSSKGHDLFLD